MSAITAGTGTVYSEVKDEGIIYTSWLGTSRFESMFENRPRLFRALVGCFGLICGAPAALGRFVYVFAFKSRRTKTFTETTNDDTVELFCREPDAMAVTSIIICENKLITDRAMTAIGYCFRITKLDLSGCSELSCGLCVCVCVCACVCNIKCVCDVYNIRCI